jgi:hypothetical protein
METCDRQHNQYSMRLIVIAQDSNQEQDILARHDEFWVVS